MSDLGKERVRVSEERQNWAPAVAEAHVDQAVRVSCGKACRRVEASSRSRGAETNLEDARNFLHGQLGRHFLGNDFRRVDRP